MKVKQKIAAIIAGISQGIYEKDEAIRLALLTALAGESIFLLGPPGVAKSLIARRLKFAFAEGKSFEYLMNRFSTPDEIFGPVSIKKLKDEDRYERLTDKYLPGANIVFLDEIWKAGSAIQNALLTILNERVYRNGEQEVAVDIRAIIAASNEVPSHGEGIEALWDRFLVRYQMHEIRQSRNFLQMITATDDVYSDTLHPDQKITHAEWEAWSAAIDAIELPAEVLNTLQLLKIKIEEYNARPHIAEERLLVYDRRWKKIVRLLRTAAFLNDRQRVDLMDCFLIAHALWSIPAQMDVVMEMLGDIIRKHGYTIALNLHTIRQEIADFEEEVYAETKIPHQVFREELLSVDTDFVEVINLRQYFDGFLVKKADFQKLSRQEQASISLYDAEHNLTNRVNAQLSHLPNTVEIFYNSQTISLALKTQKVETTEIIAKRPHPIIFKHWEERVATLTQYLNAQQEALLSNRPPELADLRHNLFVHERLAEIVEANLADAQKQLNALKLQVEKLAFYYRNL